MRNSFIMFTFLLFSLGTVFYNLVELFLGRDSHTFGIIDENRLRGASQAEREALFATLTDRSGESFQGTATLVAKARALGLMASQQTTDPKAQIEASCEALRAFGRVLKVEPNNSYALVNWSNLRQLISKHECGLEHTSGDYRKVLDQAVRYDRVSPQVAYSGALIAFWSGDLDQSGEFLNHFLELSTTLSPGQERFILARLDSPVSIEKIVPARFPQIADWSKRLYDSRTQVFDAARQVLFRMQLQAIESNLAEVSQGRISRELAAERLMSILPVVSDDSVRRRVDLELSKFLAQDQQEEVAEYLLARHSLSNLKVVPSVLHSDTRPASGSLSSWNSNESFVIDEFHNSLGFFLPEDVSVRLIELGGVKSGRSINPAQIGIFVSQDNRNWTEVSSGVTHLAFRLGGRPYLTFTANQLQYRYWKIHFGSSERARHFSGKPLEMLRVYGFGGAQ